MFKFFKNLFFATGWLCVLSIMIISCMFNGTEKLAELQINAFLITCGLLIISTVGMVIFQILEVKSGQDDWGYINRK